MLKRLLTDNGSEIYIRTPAAFGIEVNVPVSWSAIEEVVRKNGEVAIG